MPRAACFPLFRRQPDRHSRCTAAISLRCLCSSRMRTTCTGRTSISAQHQHRRGQQIHERACSDSSLGDVLQLCRLLQHLLQQLMLQHARAGDEHHHWHAWQHGPCKEAPNILHNDIGASRAACLPSCVPNVPCSDAAMLYPHYRYRMYAT